MNNTALTPYLYILMRNDLASMNAGKAVAQGAHAANQFQTRINNLVRAVSRVPSEQKIVDSYQLWLEQGCKDEGFGTSITLSVNAKTLSQTVQSASAIGLAAGEVFDPTYPIRDGAVTHLIPLITCGYVFGDKDQLNSILGSMGLMNYCGAADFNLVR